MLLRHILILFPNAEHPLGHSIAIGWSDHDIRHDVVGLIRRVLLRNDGDSLKPRLLLLVLIELLQQLILQLALGLPEQIDFIQQLELVLHAL